MFATQYRISEYNCTFASKNKGSHTYWANPNVRMLFTDWYLILNDTAKRQLHLFYIPSNTFIHISTKYKCNGINELYEKNPNDKLQKRLIDLQINYNDSLFTDIRSNIEFAKYIVASKDY